MATIQDPTGATEVATDTTTEVVAPETTGDEIELELVEEISIDGMCGVY
ncbi:MAG: hypothetical protein RIR49_495 [Actinomycetota bacterium]|jgi:mycofactocin precursor